MNREDSFDRYLQEEIAKDPSLKDDLDQISRAINIAIQLYDLRQLRGMTQKQLAEKAGISQSNVARFESAGYQGYSLRGLEKVIRALEGSITITITPKAPVHVWDFGAAVPSGQEAAGYEPNREVATPTVSAYVGV